jgi:DNA invertase Pin-like site-specific DNA recombinase
VAYVRVSTTDQNSELQIRELRAYAERQGWAIIEVYEDVMRRREVQPSGIEPPHGRCPRKEI